MKKLAIGIDIGGTNTEIGFVTVEGDVLSHKVIPTLGYREVEVFVDYVSREIYSMITELKRKENFELVGMGIGAPAANYYSGTIDYASNLSWKGIVPIVDHFQSHFPDLLITLTNDANGAAIGEMIYGGAKGMKDFMVITLGTGVGSGIVAGGDVLYGQNSFAGEVGHMIVVPNGRECGCGRRGCLDVYASAKGIVRTAFELMGDMRMDSVLRSYSFRELTSEIVYKAAKDGDALAREIFDYTGKILGKALANTCTVTFPNAIFLFGGLAQAGELIMEPTKRYMEENILVNYKGKVRIYESKLNERNATVLGASSLIWKKLGLCDDEK